MNADLKPCPHCGHMPELRKFRQEWERESRLEYHCYNGACTSATWKANEAEARQAWNTRHVPEPSEADVEAVAKAIHDADKRHYCWKTDWDLMTFGQRLEFMDHARAAIAAMSKGTT